MYNDETSIITYTHIDNVDNPGDVTGNVIRKLEQDAKKAGATQIFANISASESDLYVSLGYSEVAKIDNDRVHELCGAIVEFDKTMMRSL